MWNCGVRRSLAHLGEVFEVAQAEGGPRARELRVKGVKVRGGFLELGFALEVVDELPHRLQHPCVLVQVTVHTEQHAEANDIPPRAVAPLLVWRLAHFPQNEVRSRVDPLV